MVWKCSFGTICSWNLSVSLVMRAVRWKVTSTKVWVWPAFMVYSGFSGSYSVPSSRSVLSLVTMTWNERSKSLVWPVAEIFTAMVVSFDSTLPNVTSE